MRGVSQACGRKILENLLRNVLTQHLLVGTQKVLGQGVFQKNYLILFSKLSISTNLLLSSTIACLVSVNLIGGSKNDSSSSSILSISFNITTTSLLIVSGASSIVSKFT